MGIITLEDVIEELIGEEIVDETDQYVDVHRRIAVARARLANIRHTASAPLGAKSKKERPNLRSMSHPDSSMSLNTSSIQSVRSAAQVCSKGGAQWSRWVGLSGTDGCGQFG